MHERSKFAQEVRGIRAKLHHERRHKEKIQMKKTYVRERKKGEREEMEEGRKEGKRED